MRAKACGLSICAFGRSLRARQPHRTHSSDCRSAERGAIAEVLPMLGLATLWHDVQRLGTDAALVGIAGGCGVASLQAARWRFVTAPVLHIRYRHALAAILVGNFFNIVLPARAGDALRVDDLSRRAGVSRATLFGTEIVDF